MHRAWAPSLSVAAVLLVAGCGGSSKTTSSSGPTKAQFVARADGICNTARVKTEPLIHQLTAGGASLATGGAKGARELAPVVEQLHTTAANSLSELRALPRPSGESAAIERLLKPLGNVVSVASQAVSLLKAGQGPQALGLLAQVQPEAEAAAKAARAYGVAPCGAVLSAIP